MSDTLETILIVLGSITGLCIAVTGFMKIFPQFVKDTGEIISNCCECCECCECCKCSIFCPKIPYYIRLSNCKTGEVNYLDINIMDKKHLIVWEKDLYGGQKWLIEPQENNKIRISNSRWGEKLYLDRGEDREDIIVNPKDERGGQFWEFEKIQDDPDKFRISNSRWGIKKYLDIKDDDTSIFVTEKNLGEGQLWKKEKYIDNI